MIIILVIVLIFLILIKVFSELFIIIDGKYINDSNSEKLSLSVKKFPIVISNFLKNDISLIFKEETTTIIENILIIHQNQISYSNSYKRVIPNINNCIKNILNGENLGSSFDTFPYESKAFLKTTTLQYTKINSIVDVTLTKDEPTVTKEKVSYNYF